MTVAASKILGLRAHTFSDSTYDPELFYSVGAVVEDGGLKWRARLPVAMGHRPQGTGDGSTDDRQRLLDACDKGWAAGTTGGFAGDTYTVTSAADNSAGDIPGTIRYAFKTLAVAPRWLNFDKDVFPLADPTTITLVDNLEIGPNTTIDGRGAGVRFSGYPIEFRSDRGSPIVTNRGLSTANVIIAYVDFVNFPNGTSVVEFGGNNPFRRGGSDMVYLHHCTVNDIEDQNMSNGEHANYISRSTMDWCRFGPSPGPRMMALTTHGGLKMFSVSAADRDANVITTLDALGNPQNHDLIALATGARAPFNVNTYRRADQSTHPYPAGMTSGDAYTVRHVGLSTAPQQTFTADSTTNTLTATAHGYNNGDPVVVIGTVLPGSYTGDFLRNGYIYYVKDATANTFRLAVKAGGGTKSFDDNGSGTLKVQKADLTKFQLSADGGTNWLPSDALDITGIGSGWYAEIAEPVYFTDGKGPQWGSHHPDDMQDAMLTFNVDPATDTFTTFYPHLMSDGQEVRFWAQAGGIPTGITQGQSYYMRDTTSTTFKVETAIGAGAVNLTSQAASEQSFTADAASNVITAAGHGLHEGDMVTFYGGSVPSATPAGIVFWVRGGGPGGVLTTDTFTIAQRKGDDPLDIGAGSGTLIKKPPVVQLIIGPNRVSITLCDFRNMNIRSPKVQISWGHLWNNRNYHWGDPDRGSAVGGFGNEIADGGQVLIEGGIFRPYATGEAHYWSAFTNPPETVPTLGPSIYGIEIDTGSIGPVDTHDWTGGASVIQRDNRFEGDATTRNAAGGTTAIVNDPRLDWFDPAAGKPVPYDYTVIPVVADSFILDTILDRGAGNVQPWELVT